MVETNIPYFKSKAEEVNKDPKILIFHEVISENEIAYFKEESYKVVRIKIIILLIVIKH